MSLLAILVLLFVVMWLLVIRRSAGVRLSSSASRTSRPGRKCSRRRLYGTVHSVVDDDEVRVEIAPDVQVRVTRQAIAAVLTDDDDG